jgi:hypothetical protein
VTPEVETKPKDQPVEKRVAYPSGEFDMDGEMDE